MSVNVEQSAWHNNPEDSVKSISLSLDRCVMKFIAWWNGCCALWMEL